MGLEGKTAIVTGGAQGIGKCTALSLLREGMNVIIADVDTEAGLECVADHMPAGQIQFVPTDVGNETAVANCVRRAVELFGGVDALVNNAGVGIERKIEAFLQYRNEVQDDSQPWSAAGLRALARYHGLQSGVEYAEAFHVIRGFEGLLP